MGTWGGSHGPARASGAWTRLRIHADGTGDARTAEPAVASRILGEVLLGIILGVAGHAAAHLAIVRVRRGASGIADGGRIDARCLPELPFSAPEAAHAEHRLLEPGRKRRREPVAVDEVRVGNRHRLRAPGKRLVGLWHSQFHS